jgi:hypothetical protein
MGNYNPREHIFLDICMGNIVHSTFSKDEEYMIFRAPFGPIAKVPENEAAACQSEKTIPNSKQL